MPKKYIKLIILIIVVAAVGYGAYQMFFAPKEEAFEIHIVQKGDIVEDISETGKVVSQEEIDLFFKSSGRVEEIYVEEGDVVEKGQPIMKLETDELQIRLREAQAAVNSAWAGYQVALAGSTSEQIQIYQTMLENAEKNLENVQAQAADSATGSTNSLEEAETAYNNAVVALENAEETADNNLENAYESARTTMKIALSTMTSALAYADSVLGIDDKNANDSFEIYLSVRDATALLTAENTYEDARDEVDDLAPTVSYLTSSSSQETVDRALLETEQTLSLVAATLSYTRDVLDASTDGYGFSYTQLAGLKSTIDSARTSVSTAVTNVQGAKQSVESTKVSNASSIDAAEAGVAAAEKSLESVRSGKSSVSTDTQAAIDIAEGQVEDARAQLMSVSSSLRDVDRAVYLASIDAAKANYDLIAQQIEDATLTAPSEGIVTDIAYDAGELAMSSMPALSLISNKYELELEVSELDINSIKENHPLLATFDALGSEEYRGHVTEIAASETVKDDDIYYKVTAVLDNADVPVKPGMTADISIRIGEALDALIIPERLVIERKNKNYVSILKNGNVTEVEITLGLESGRNVQVTSGLREGDMVIIE